MVSIIRRILPLSIAVLIGLRISQKPPDQNHHYGHLRAETVASLVASFIMAAVGLQVLINAGSNLLHPIHETPSLLTAFVAGGSAIVMYVVYRYNLKLAKRINSSAVRAAAYDNRSDALVSLGAYHRDISSYLWSSYPGFNYRHFGRFSNYENGI